MFDYTENKTPRLRFNEFEGAWSKLSLDEISIVNMGQSPSSKSYNQSGEGVLLIQGNADIKDRLTNPRQWTSEPTKKCKIGDLILTVRAPVGTIAKSKHNACIGRGVCSISNNSKSDIEYLYQALVKYEKKWVRLEQGSTFTAVSGNDIRGFKIGIPSIAEQQKIAEFLSSVDKKIQLLEKKKEQLALYKKGVMQKIFSQEIRFKDDNGNSFPDWEIKTMGDIIKFLSDYTANGSFGALKENVKYFSSPNYAALVRTTDLEKNFFEPKRFTDKRGYDFLKKTSLFGGEIIMANVGSIGKVYKAPNKYEGLMTLAPNTYVLKFHNNIDEEFIFQLMLRIEFKYKLLSMVGSSTLKAINKSNLRSIKIELPFYNEQKKIADFLSAIDNKIEITLTQIEKTKKFKKGLLQQMFV